MYGRPHNIIIGLLPREGTAGCLRVEAEFEAPLVFGPVTFADQQSPQPPCGTILGNFFEEIVVRIKEEAEAGRKVVDMQASFDGPIGVLNAVPQRKGKFLRRRRARLPNVIPADGYRIEAWRVAGSVFDGVSHQPHRRSGRVQKLLLRNVFLQDVVLQSARKPRRVGPLLFRRHQIHGPDDGGGRIDGH